MIDKLIINISKLSYRHHRKMCMHYYDRYFVYLEKNRMHLCDYCLNNAIKHDKKCKVIDTLIYSLAGEDI